MSLHDEEDQMSPWEDLRDATPPDWYVGWPMEIPEHHRWEMYAFDMSELPVAGHRKREWTAVGRDELGVVAEMGRSLARIKVGRTPA
jgi:hypothetical protein